MHLTADPLDRGPKSDLVRWDLDRGLDLKKCYFLYSLLSVFQIPHMFTVFFSAAFFCSSCSRGKMDSQATQAEPQAQKKCWLCLLSYDDSQGRLHGKKFLCGTCSNAHRTMRRNLGNFPEEMQSFSSEEIADFFRALHAKKPAGCGLNWQTMKAVMCTNIATRQVESNKDKVKSEWLPASVWVTRGWSKDTIERQENRWSDEYQSQVYKIQVASEVWEQVHQRITESLLRQEREATKKRGRGAEDLDVPVASVPKDDPNTKGQVAAAKKQERENDKIHALAARAVGAWTKILVQCEKMADKVTSAADMPAETKQIYEELTAKLQKNVTAAHQAINGFEQNKGKPVEKMTALAQLPFQAADVKIVTQQSGVILKEVRKVLPKAAAKRKAQEVPPNQEAQPKQRRRRGKSNP